MGELSPQIFRRGCNGRVFVPKFPKSGVSVWVGVGQLPLLPPGSVGPLRVIVVGVKRDFVEFF